LLRRTPRIATEDVYDFGEIHVNLKKGIVYRGWERVALSEREFASLSDRTRWEGRSPGKSCSWTSGSTLPLRRHERSICTSPNFDVSSNAIRKAPH
jgi:hypothetical protein